MISAYLRKFVTAAVILISFIPARFIAAQDTMYVSLQEFVQLGIERSNQLKSSEAKWQQAIQKAEKIGKQRYLPTFSITTNHGLVPGVKSNSDLPKSEWHLDPNLENDWSNWSIFTQADLKAVQPLFTWGALSSASKAANAGADAAEYQFQMDEAELMYNLFQIYQSRLLADNLKGLVVEAKETFRQAEKRIEKMYDQGDLETKDFFQFRISKEKFLIQIEEVEQNLKFIKRSWQLALDEDTTVTVLPKGEDFSIIEPETFDATYFEQAATMQRNEIKALDASITAAKEGVWAEKAQMLPLVYFGFGGEYVSTPRPAQNQPLLGDRYNYLNLVYSFGIRQNLNFWVQKEQIDMRQYQLREAQHGITAVRQGVILEVRNDYKNYMVNRTKAKQIEKAFVLSKEWLRTEQIDYDLGLGDVENVVDATKTSLELEAEFNEAVYQNNIKLGKLLHSSGILSSFIFNQ
jgi:outer membrane protein TolC